MPQKLEKVWNMFKVNNKVNNDAIGVILVSLLSTLNMFHTFTNKRPLANLPVRSFNHIYVIHFIFVFKSILNQYFTLLSAMKKETITIIKISGSVTLN